jgi:hypothetical protein
MAESEVVGKNKGLDEEADIESANSLDERGSIVEQKPSNRDPGTEIRLMFRIGAILSNAVGK